jgi:hypothetical protein
VVVPWSVVVDDPRHPIVTVLLRWSVHSAGWAVGVRLTPVALGERYWLVALGVRLTPVALGERYWLVALGERYWLVALGERYWLVALVEH